MGKPIILYASLLNSGTVTASDTDADPQYDVLNLRDLKTYTWWKALDTTTPKYIEIDCGEEAVPADIFGLMGHNLGSIGAEVSIEGSDDEFAADILVQVSPFTPADDHAILRKLSGISVTDSGIGFMDGDVAFMPGDVGFMGGESGAAGTSIASRKKWRLKIDGTLTGIPQIAIMMIGEKLEMPYPNDTPFNLVDEGITAEDNSSAAHLLETIFQYNDIELECRIGIHDRTWSINNLKPFWDDHARKKRPHFYAPDIDIFPGYVFWVRPSGNYRYQMPLSIGSYVDSFSYKMQGIREE